jgi:hypothetical protein
VDSRADRSALAGLWRPYDESLRFKLPCLGVEERKHGAGIITWEDYEAQLLFRAQSPINFFFATFPQ